MSAGGESGGVSHSKESQSKLLSDSSGAKVVQAGSTGSSRQVLGSMGKVFFGIFAMLSILSLLFPFRMFKTNHNSEMNKATDIMQST
jgi:hypothetical protein